MGLWKHPGVIAGVCVALGIYYAFTTVHTNNRITKIQGDVRVINRSSPCTGLTTSECALKLVRALPAEQKRQLSVNEHTLRRLERLVRRQRRRLDSGQSVIGANGQKIGGKRDSGVHSGGRIQQPPRPHRTPASRPGGGGSGSSPGGSGTQPRPTVQTPAVTVPATPVSPAITVPSITVPCVDVKPVTSC